MRFLFLCFLVIPIVEMLILIEVGSSIGGLSTIGLVLLTAIIGASLLKKQGLSTFVKANKKMQEGQMPVAEMGEGLVLAVAGALLLTPGFVTDAIGFLLLTPGFRSLTARFWINKMMQGNQKASFNARTYESNASVVGKEHDVIEGEFKEVDGSNGEKNV